MRPELADLWIWFADNVCREYSPIYDRVSRTVATSEPVLALVEQAPPRSHQPNVLLAAVHYLILGGLDHPLAAVYAGNSDADPGPLFVDVCSTYPDEIMRLLRTRHTNTNEVGRSAIVALALSATAERAGTPLAHVDVGCSAGLNLYCDRYRLDYGGAGATGPAGAAVEISCEVVGGRPPIAPAVPPIVERIGIDLDPVDVTDDDQALWQLALVFPDTNRLPRTRRALEELRRDPPRIVQGDAVDTVGPVLRGLHSDAFPIVTTTWAAAYFPAERRAEFRERLAEVSRTRPVVWVSAEGPGVVDLFAGVDAPYDAQGLQASVLGLAHFEGGGVVTELLGFAHPHGQWVDWRAN
ncbi:MAG TPA: DUF2332 domain-containing protein [Acidimicrobiia bacterium]|nr:DUF2332 domain-containing protein [Acidimicrobiia bacterium]